MTNVEIKIEMARHGLKQWQVASILGISESVFSRKIRNELPSEEQERIIALIREHEMAKER